jgi:hypothetical protein
MQKKLLKTHNLPLENALYLNIFAAMSNTKQQYTEILQQCKDIFIRKNSDYGTSWRLFRPSSLTDQLFIKAQRIRNIEDSGKNNVGDDIKSEFLGIVNYTLMALIQLELQGSESSNLADLASPEKDKAEKNLLRIIEMYDNWSEKTMNLMLLKNSDYSEVWRQMRISSFTDMILVKLARIKQIEDNLGQTTVSEGVEANYQDIMNYAIFALIRMSE